MDGSLPAASGTPLPPSSSPELALLAPDGPDLPGPSLRGDGARFEPLWTGNLGRETEGGGHDHYYIAHLNRPIRFVSTSFLISQPLKLHI